jgi:hypothetical protein
MITNTDHDQGESDGKRHKAITTQELILIYLSLRHLTYLFRSSDCIIFLRWKSSKLMYNTIELINKSSSNTRWSEMEHRNCFLSSSNLNSDSIQFNHSHLTTRNLKTSVGVGTYLSIRHTIRTKSFDYV